MDPHSPSAPPPAPPRDRDWHWLRDGATALLLVFLLGLGLWRSSFEGGIWVDELLSIQLAHLSVPDLIDRDINGGHPPTYYIILKAWNKFGSLCGLTPGPLWGRLPGILCWAMMAAAAWAVGRRMLGPNGGALLAAAIACSAEINWGARNMRSYALAAPALGIGFLLLSLLIDASRRGELRAAVAAKLWGLYGLLAAAALWLHLLSGFMLLPLGLWWIYEVVADARRRGLSAALQSPLAVGGAIVQAAAIACFLPYLGELHHNLSSIRGVRRDWMTPPTLANFLRVFALWYPWGRVYQAPPGSTAAGLLTFAGVFTLAIPSTAAVWALVRVKRSFDSSVATINAPLRLMIAGALIAIANVATLWGLDRANIQHVFHGPHYPMFTATCWAAGLAGCCLYSMRRAQWPAAAAWLLLAPWLLTNLAGQIDEALRERRGLLPGSMAMIKDQLPKKGEPLYVMPSELIPYFRKTLSRFDVHPVEDMASATSGTVHVLRISNWVFADRIRDVSVEAAIENNELAENTDKIGFPPGRGWDQYILWDLHGFRPEVAKSLAARGYGPMPARFPPDAGAEFDLKNLRMRDGWNVLEIGAKGDGWCWSSGGPSLVRLKSPLAPGKYAISLQGLRQPYPQPDETLWVGIEGEPDRAALKLGPGWFDASVELTATRAHEHPILVLDHPRFRMMDFQPGNPDDRPMGFLLHGLAIAKSE